MFAFIVDYKLRAVKVILGLMRSIWSKVLGFRSYPCENTLFLCSFSGFLLVGPVTLKKPARLSVQFFFWSNHRTGLIFKTMVVTARNSEPDPDGMGCEQFADSQYVRLHLQTWREREAPDGSDPAQGRHWPARIAARDRH
jgi:hypothetical protein